MSPLTFSFKQVEAILADVFEIAPEKRKAFVSRIQLLQRLGLPPQTNVGRGKRVAYKGWQLCDMQFYLDLIDAGVTPSLIASRFQELGFYAVDGAGRFGENAAKVGGSYFTHVRLNAIEHLTLVGTTFTEENDTFNAFSDGRDLDAVVKVADGEPGILIDLGRRLARLKSAIARADPLLADQDLFVHFAFENEV